MAPARSNALLGASAVATFGSITLDADLADWAAPVYDDGAGHRVYARYQDGYFIFAATGTGPGTSFWLNTDRNSATGYQSGGEGGAEYLVDLRYPAFPTYFRPILIDPGTGSFLYPYDFLPSARGAGIIEFAVPAAVLGSNLTSLDFKVAFGGSFVDTVFTAAPPVSFGGIALDGSIVDWAAGSEIPIAAQYAPPGSRFFATASEGAFVFALKTSFASAGAHVLIDSDHNAAAGVDVYGQVNELLVKLPGGPYYPIAHGVDYQVQFDAAGTPLLYTGDGSLVGALQYAATGDTVEFAVPQALMSGAQPASVTLEFYDGLYGVQYQPPTVTVNSPHAYADIMLDGYLRDWTSADELALSPNIGGYYFVPEGTRAFAKYADGTFLFALSTGPLAQTHILIDADNNNATGATLYGSYQSYVYALASGIDYQIGFDVSGAATLYSGDGTTVLTSLDYAIHDHVVELALPGAVIDSTTARIQLETYDGHYPQGYYPPSYIIAPKALDGSLAEWTAAERIYSWQTGIVGYEIYGKSAGDDYVIALKAPMAIGPNTTVWINADANMMSGYKVWGFAAGAEYFVNFDASGKPNCSRPTGCRRCWTHRVRVQC